MKKLVLMLLLFAPLSLMAQTATPKFGHVNAQAIMESLPDLQLQAYEVEEGSPVAGRTLAEAALRKEHGVTAAGVRRGESINNNPDAQTRLQAGDVVYLLATQEAMTKAAWLFHAETGRARA